MCSLNNLSPQDFIILHNKQPEILLSECLNHVEPFKDADNSLTHKKL
jgi:hypothetical protein